MHGGTSARCRVLSEVCAPALVGVYLEAAVHLVGRESIVYPVHRVQCRADMHRPPVPGLVLGVQTEGSPLRLTSVNWRARSAIPFRGMHFLAFRFGDVSFSDAAVSCRNVAA